MTTYAEAVEHTRKWFFLEAFIPVAVVWLLYWPLGLFGLGMSYPFQQVFAGSDLLTVCSLLLFGLSIDIESLRGKKLPYEFWTENLRYIAFTTASLYLLLYGFLKVKFLTYTFPTPTTPPAPVANEINAIACFIVAATVFTIFFSFASRIFIVFVFHRYESQQNP